MSEQLPCPACNDNGRNEMIKHCPECKGSGLALGDGLGWLANIRRKYHHALNCKPGQLPNAFDWQLVARGCEQVAGELKLLRSELARVTAQRTPQPCGVPTEPGYYWFWLNGGGRTPVHVTDDNGLYANCLHYLAPSFYVADSPPGRWFTCPTPTEEAERAE